MKNLINDFCNNNLILQLVYDNTIPGWIYETNSDVISSTFNPTTKIITFSKFDGTTFSLDLNPVLGSGSSGLNDLSDVTVSSPTTGQILALQASGQFANVSVISGGTY